MASVNYLGRIQLVENRTQATKKQQHSCYTHTTLGRNSNNERRSHHWHLSMST